MKGGDRNMKQTAVTIFAVGTMLLSSLGSLLGTGSLLSGNSVTTATGANVTSDGTTTSATVGNQTGADVLGNSVQATTGLSANLGL